MFWADENFTEHKTCAQAAAAIKRKGKGKEKRQKNGNQLDIFF